MTSLEMQTGFPSYYLHTEIDQKTVRYVSEIEKVKETNLSQYKEIAAFHTHLTIFIHIINGTFHLPDDPSVTQTYSIGLIKEGYDPGILPKPSSYRARFTRDNPREPTTIHFEATLDQTYKCVPLGHSYTIQGASINPGSTINTCFRGRNITEIIPYFELQNSELGLVDFELEQQDSEIGSETPSDINRTPLNSILNTTIGTCVQQ